jgi:hypothetical protein
VTKSFDRMKVGNRTCVRYHDEMTATDQLQRLETLDVASLSMSEVSRALVDVRVVRGRTDQLEAALAQRVRELHRAGQASPPADALGHAGRTSRRAAERAERRADALNDAPSLDSALGRGAVSAEHADVVASSVAQLDDAERRNVFERETEITQLAAENSPDAFRRKLRKLVDEVTDADRLSRDERQRAATTASLRRDDETGMHVFIAKLTPEDGNRLRRRLEHEVAALAQQPRHRGLRRDQLRVRAFMGLVMGGACSSSLAPAEVGVMIDHQTLVSGLHESSVCEYSDGTPIPVGTARRHACEADIIPIVMGGDGQPLDVGRARRLATRAQRVALRSMYRTCAAANCDRDFDQCHVHHLDDWVSGGPTDLGNLVPLCSFHHHRAHEGRWRLQLDPSTRQLTITLPSGHRHSTSMPDVMNGHDRSERDAA